MAEIIKFPNAKENATLILEEKLDTVHQAIFDIAEDHLKAVAPEMIIKKDIDPVLLTEFLAAALFQLCATQVLEFAATGAGSRKEYYRYKKILDKILWESQPSSE